MASNQSLAFSAFNAIASLRSTNDLAELDRIVGPLFADLGFPHFISGQFFSASKAQEPRVLHGRMPEGWSRRYAQSNYAGRSPIARRMLCSAAPYTWSGIMVAQAPDSPGRKIWDEARDFGLSDGIYIPMRGIDMSYRAVVLAGPAPDLRDPFLVTVAEILGAHYGLEGRRLTTAHIGAKTLLTDRQRECLLWAREGKSSGVIGEILCLSPATVNEHVRGACQTLGVSTRVQAVVEATRLGLLDC